MVKTLIDCEQVISSIKNDVFSVSVYWYLDDDNTAYISSLKVSDRYKGIGIASSIVSELEVMLKSLGFSKVLLWVDKMSWMKLWYERIGYSYFQDHEVSKYVYMIKYL